MARVTVEDCLDNVENRFELVLVASKRARQLANGKPPMLEWEGDKVTVMALREIAEGHITASILTEVEVEEKEEDLFMDSGESTANSDSESANKELSSDELLASQVEALLAASNDILSGSSSVVETPSSLFEDKPSVESTPVQRDSNPEPESSGFSADLLKSAFMNYDKQAADKVEDKSTDNTESSASDSEAGDSDAS